MNRLCPYPHLIWIASLDDGEFGPGAPWKLAPWSFAALEELGLIRCERTWKGRPSRAITTEAGAAALASWRTRKREQRAACEAAHRRRQESWARYQARLRAAAQADDKQAGGEGTA